MKSTLAVRFRKARAAKVDSNDSLLIFNSPHRAYAWLIQAKNYH